MQESFITSTSSGNVSAGKIDISVAAALRMDSSFISTTFISSIPGFGDGGAINVDGGKTIELLNSGFTTSVRGANGIGGDILLTAGELLMETG